MQVTRHNNLHTVRGDQTRGGSKTAALLRYLPTLGQHHFAYAGTVYGSGAWAVATACAQLGLKCSLCIAKSDYTPTWLDDIPRLGATLHWVDPVPVVQIHDTITHTQHDLCNLPLGFDTPEFISAMSGVMCDTLGHHAPTEIWLPSLSGVLARAACMAFPHLPVHAVSAARHAGDTGRAIMHMAPEKFHRPALHPPPYPACPFSDAKVWQFAEKMAVSGAFIWNVSV